MTDRERQTGEKLLHQLNAVMSTFDRIITALGTSYYVKQNITSMMERDIKVTIQNVLKEDNVDVADFSIGYAVKRDLAGLVSVGMPIDAVYMETFCVNSLKGLFNKTMSIGAVTPDDKTIIDVSLPYVGSITFDRLVFKPDEPVLPSDEDTPNEMHEEN